MLHKDGGIKQAVDIGSKDTREAILPEENLKTFMPSEMVSRAVERHTHKEREIVRY